MEGHLSSAECMLVRETMVRQEKMYREQVQALHYLYQVQKTLMDEHVSKNCWDVSSTVYQFFPPKEQEEEHRRRPERNFDLEKLPDECQKPDFSSTALDFNNCFGDANVELALHPGPRYRTRAFMDSTPNPRAQAFSASQAYQSPEFQNYQPYFRSEETGLNTNYFQLGNSWLHPASQPRGKREPNDRVGEPWFAQPSSTHPWWQVSGAAYYSSSSSVLQGTSFPTVLQGTYFSKGACAHGVQPANGLGKDVLGFYLQQEEERRLKVAQHRNVYSNPLLDYLSSRGTLHGSSRNSACILGSDRNFYRENGAGLNTDLTCSQRQTTAETVKTGDGRSQEEETGVESAASVLVSLTLDTTFCPRVNSPLKKSVEWFADAMPEEVDEAGGDEVDHFESEMLLLKEIEFEEHAPLCLETEPAGPPSPKPVQNGRPSRLCKRKRDFRSDTLPSITSLSRQEINEDIQMMSGLLRSVKADNATSGGGGGRRGKRNSNSPVSTLDVVNKEDSAGLPWLVSWGVATRRKRKKRQRVSQKLQLLKGTASSSLSMLLTCSFAKKK